MLHKTENVELAGKQEREIRQRSLNQEVDQNQLVQRTQKRITRIQRGTGKVGRRISRAARKLYRRSPGLGIQAREDISTIIKDPKNVVAY